MFYRELKKTLESFSEEQLNQDVTIFSEGEYYAGEIVYATEECDVLDLDHPIIRAC